MFFNKEGIMQTLYATSCPSAVLGQTNVGFTPVRDRRCRYLQNSELSAVKSLGLYRSISLQGAHLSDCKGNQNSHGNWIIFNYY